MTLATKITSRWQAMLLGHNLSLAYLGCGCHSPVCNCEGSSSLPVQSVWYLWWTKWHWDGLCFQHFGFPLSLLFCSVSYSYIIQQHSTPFDLTKLQRRVSKHQNEFLSGHVTVYVLSWYVPNYCCMCPDAVFPLLSLKSQSRPPPIVRNPTTLR